MPSDVKKKAKRVLSVAKDLYRRELDWVTFFREVIGVNGAMHAAFPEPRALAAFKRTSEYIEIEQMVTRLREKVEEQPPTESVKVITVRLPQSMHDSLTGEAKKYNTSVNKLCLSKLMQIIDEKLVPKEFVGSRKQASENGEP